MSDTNETILALELRVGILEDRLACAEPGVEEIRIEERLEEVRDELKSERYSHCEFLRMRGPG